MNYLVDYLAQLWVSPTVKRTFQHSPIYYYNDQLNNLEPIKNQITDPEKQANLCLLDGLTCRKDHFARCFDGQLLQILVNIDWKLPVNQFRIQRLYEKLISQTYPVDITYYASEDELTIEMVGKAFYREKFFLRCEN